MKDQDGNIWTLRFSERDYSGYDRHEGGKYFYRCDYPDGSTCIEEFPSESYSDNFLLGLNRGCRIKETWINR